MADNTYSSRVHCHVSSFLHFRINEENDSLRGFCFHLSIFIFSVFCVFSHFLLVSWGLFYILLLPGLLLFLLVSCRLYLSSSFLSFLVAYISLLPFSNMSSSLYIFTPSSTFLYRTIFRSSYSYAISQNHHNLLQIFPSFQSYVISLKDLSVKPQYSKKLIHVTPMDHPTLHITARDKQKFFCCCCCAGKIIQQGIGFFNEGLGNPVEYNRLWRDCECKIYFFSAATISHD